MLPYPDIDPIAFHIVGWPVYWYGLMYLVGFLVGWGVLALRLRATKNPPFTQEQLSDIAFFAALGAIVGGRLGYIFFYDWDMLISHPAQIVQTWKGGMAFHGGALGVMLAMWLCARKMRKHFLELTDFLVPGIPIGLGAGRIGNFINGELWGRVTDVPWAMVFPSGGPVPRHPSQLYEFLLEGVLLFLILWIYSRKPRPLGAVSGLFALCYGIFRCFIEFYREPLDGYFFNLITVGQFYSIPLILIGIFLIVWAYTKEKKHETVS